MKNKYIVITFVLMILIQLLLVSQITYAEDITNTTVLVNNQRIASLTVNGTVLSPIYELSNILGVNYSFDANSPSYLTTKLFLNETEITLTLDNVISQVNGKYISMPAPMRIINNRIYVPIKFISQALGAEIFTNTRTNELMIFQPQNNNIVYLVQPGDSLWKISQIFGTSISYIKTQNKLPSDTINIGQTLIVKPYTPSNLGITGTITTNASLRSGPSSSTTLISYLQVGTPIEVLGKNGSWYRVKCSKGTGYASIWVATLTQDTANTTVASKYFSSKIPVDTSQDTVTYTVYTVVKGDTIWSIAQRNGIPNYELLSVNKLSSSSVLNIGQKLTVPVHNIVINPNQNGLEMLDWFTQANYVFPILKIGKLTDVPTGKSFMVKRTIGANHSDTETLTAQDTQTMKDIFGGTWNWTRRPFILEVDGRRIAISAAGMPHAGVDGVPFYQNVANRSDNYGYGPNMDMISGNGMNGHFDLYFLNCLRHVDNQLDPSHQLSVSIAGGLK